MHLLIYNLVKPRGLDPDTADRIAWKRTFAVIGVWCVIWGVACYFLTKQ